MSDRVDGSVLPIRRAPFAGVADKTLGGSQPDWGLIGHVKHPAEAPNVLLVLIDDAGASATPPRSAAPLLPRLTTGWRRRGCGTCDPTLT
jgi:hypothetical protein